MPTIAREGPYRIYFYSHEPNEPPHVHIDKEGQSAKFWLHDAGLARNSGFSARELGMLRRLVLNRRLEFAKAWDAFFRTS
jgi:hypothetical protein